MAQTNNQFTLIGRLTRDPEQRDAGNSKVTVITLAVDQPPKRDRETGETIKDPNSGYAVKDTDFPRINLWGKLGDTVMAQLSKGSQIAVSGQIRTRTVQAKVEGEKNMFYTDLRAEDIRFLEPKKTAAAAPAADSTPQPAKEEF